MRLIDADWLKSYIDSCEFCESCELCTPTCAKECDMPNYLTGKWERAIDEQPTVDPVKHGHWLPVTGDWWKCSECHCEDEKGSDYCPNCGAKMDEEVQDDV